MRTNASQKWKKETWQQQMQCSAMLFPFYVQRYLAMDKKATRQMHMNEEHLQRTGLCSLSSPLAEANCGTGFNVIPYVFVLFYFVCKSQANFLFLFLRFHFTFFFFFAFLLSHRMHMNEHLYNIIYVQAEDYKLYAVSL